MEEATETPTGIELCRTATFHYDRCIICQKPHNENKNEVEGTAGGIASLKRAADARDDGVMKKRILELEETNKPFIYHNNECYKTYTHKIETLTGIELCKSASFHHDRCIICQKPHNKYENKKEVEGTANGIASLKRAADAREDGAMKKRILALEEMNKPFIYHNNNECYKTYTHKKYVHTSAIEQPTQDAPTLTQDIDKSTQMLRRSSVTPRDKPLEEKRENANPKKRKCVYCGSDRVWVKKTKKYVYEKYRISETDVAQHFLDATRCLQDEVYSRTADLTSVELLTAADLFYHRQCRNVYATKYKCESSSKCEIKPKPPCEKEELFNLALKKLDKRINEGIGFTITEIREYMSSLDKRPDPITLYNRDVKKLLENHYGENIQFALNPQQNKSELVFLSSISSADVASKISNLNILKSAGESLRQSIKEVDFGLDDSFCDAPSLKRSWENTAIPDDWMTFYSALFNIRRITIDKKQKPCVISTKAMFDDDSENEQSDSDDDYSDIDSDDEDINSDYNDLNGETSSDESENEGESQVDEKNDDDTSNNKTAKIMKSLKKLKNQLSAHFQITYYKLTHGTHKTPLQILTADSVYGRTRSKGIITNLNFIGATTSYTEMKRQRNLRKQYTLSCDKPNEAPIPSHFSRVGWTMGALDNENFADQSSISGTNVKNYTAQVLYQDAMEEPVTKPSVSSTNLKTTQVCSEERLSCQELKTVYKPTIRPSLPPSFQTIESVGLEVDDSKPASKNSEKIEFLITLLRCGLPGEIHQDAIPPWAGVHALITQSQSPLMRVGFMPVIPHPVTEYATVRKSMTNFQSIRAQLKQPIMPVFCDEGVYHLMIDIILNEPEIFQDLFPMLGNFHLTKILLRCAGRYLGCSGIGDALIEGGVFGKKVLVSVLSGGHYVRSLHGMFVISEVFYSLAWKAFWKTKVHDPALIQHFNDLRRLLQTKNRNKCVNEFQIALTMTAELKEEFEVFLEECKEKSEICKYLAVFQEIFKCIKNLVAADRDGDWHLHVEAVRSAMPIFRGFDAINYIRYASFYLEKIQVLQITHPSLYEKFKLGYFVVRDRQQSYFSSVAGDLKLEQSINRFSKGMGGYVCVGSAGNVSAVAEFELLFHEILQIINFVDELMGSKLKHLDTNIQHSLHGSKGLKFHNNILRVLDIVNGKGNPYENVGLAVQPPLHNLMTKAVVEDKQREGILNVIQTGEKEYLKFRNERYIEKNKKITAKISKITPSLFKSPTNDSSKDSNDAADITSKDIAVAQRKMDIALIRGMSKEDVLSHDLLEDSILFDSSTAKTNKSTIVPEIEGLLGPIEKDLFKKESKLVTHEIVDFMSHVRQQKFVSGKTFNHTISSVLDSMQRVTDYDVLHILFDSYMPLSIKESERARRQGDGDGIELARIDEMVTVPEQIDKFWPVSTNKENLQVFTRKLALQKIENLVLSSMVIEEEIIDSVHKNSEEKRTIDELNSWDEEADDRVILHTNWAIKHGAKRVVVLSNDSDTMMLLLRYVEDFIQSGLIELWLQYGTSESRRLIPLHLWYTKLGVAWCKNLIKVHIITGNDYLSTIGTKLAAIRLDPLKYLSEFGESQSMREVEMALAEQYLVLVWNGVRGATSARTFDELRVERYNKSTIVSLDKLPPTSSVVREHLIKGFSLVRRASTLLDYNRVPFNPINKGWFLEDGKIYPSKGLKRLPAELLGICGCKGRCKGRCKCKTAGQICVPFCHKNAGEKCENKQ